MGGLY